MKYIPLSENGGILVDAQERAYRLDHIGDNLIAHVIATGERPTIMNREFANRFLKEHAERGMCHLKEIPEGKATQKRDYKQYGYAIGQDVFSNEYQLYLSAEMERAIYKKGKTTNEDKHAIRELTGLLPHEEEQEIH